jgi:hypothetical protein
MIDGNINQNFAVALVNGIDQFDELFQRGGMGVEDSQGRVNSRKAQCGIGASKSSHAAIGGRCGMNRKQHYNSAPEVADNKVELGDQITKRSRGRNYGIITLIKIPDAFFQR